MIKSLTSGFRLRSSSYAETRR